MRTACGSPQGNLPDELCSSRAVPGSRDVTARLADRRLSVSLGMIWLYYRGLAQLGSAHAWGA